MAERAKRLVLKDNDKLAKVNPETLKLYKRYETDMVIRELSPKTISGYHDDLIQFWIWVYDKCENKSMKDLIEDDVIDYIAMRKMEGANSRRIKRIMSSLAAMYKFLKKRHLVEENICENLDRPKKDSDIVVTTFLTPQQLENMKIILQEFVDNQGTVAKKHQALQIQIFTLFSLSTLARVGATSSIDWEQIDMERREVLNVKEKEGKIVTLYFNEKVKEKFEELQQFRKDNYIDDNGHVFVGTAISGKQATPGTCHGWSKKVGELIGIPTWHCHLTRKNGATSLHRRGMEIEDIQILCHHEDMSTTAKFYIAKDESKTVENKDKFEIE